MYALDLFSGYGGITKALTGIVRPIAYCEIEHYPRSILFSRMETGDLPVAPIWDDVTTLDGKQFRGKVDIIYGGFPCQDISSAGRGAGLEGKRSGLFFEVCRLVEEVQPRFVFLENVPAIRTRGLAQVTESLAALGYDLRWTCVSAASVGAMHLRKRWFLLGHAKHDGSSPSERPRGLKEASDARCESREIKASELERADHELSVLAHSNERGLPPSRSEQQTARFAGENRECGRSTKSRLGGVVDGTPEWMDSAHWQSEPDIPRVTQEKKHRKERIMALGNGVVPLQVRTAFLKLLGDSTCATDSTHS